jgi:hypothetical protein
MAFKKRALSPTQSPPQQALNEPGTDILPLIGRQNPNVRQKNLGCGALNR